MKPGSLKRSQAIAVGTIVCTPASAEVCDNVRPAWNTADGQISQFESLALFFTEPLGLIVLMLALAAALLRKIWITAIVVALLCAIITLNISTWITVDYVTKLAISEGCITAPVLTTITLIAICAIIVAVTWRSSRLRKRAA